MIFLLYVWNTSRTAPGYYSDEGRMIFRSVQFTTTELSFLTASTLVFCAAVFWMSWILDPFWNITAAVMYATSTVVLLLTVGTYVPDRPNSPFLLGVFGLFAGICGGTVIVVTAIVLIIGWWTSDENART